MNIKKSLRSLTGNSHGQGLLEYAIILILVVVVLAIIIGLFRSFAWATGQAFLPFGLGVTVGLLIGWQVWGRRGG